MTAKHHYPTAQEFKSMLIAMLGPEAPYYRVILTYSIAISLLTLAIPISVQLLIDTVSNTGLPRAVITIGLILFGLLLCSGVLYAFRAWSMELYNRRLFSRMSSEIAMTGLIAEVGYFEQEQHSTLFNRFFDIMTLKKNIPYLLSHGFTLLFQSVIGFIVVSLYHIYLLVFSLCLILIIFFVWKIWGWKAIESSFHLSEAKHNTASWLQGLGVNNGFYKTRRNQASALDKTNESIHHHLDQQAIHFRFSYSQLLSFLFIYALASSVLLSIGGLLVIQGELTLGQLVSAELIMSAIFYGLPQLASYFDYYYDVCAAIEELSRFDSVVTEKELTGLTPQWPEQPALSLRKVLAKGYGINGEFSLDVSAGAIVNVISSDRRLDKLFCALLKRLVPISNGSLKLGNLDLIDCHLADLREAVVVVDRQTLLPLSIRDYLALSGSEATSSIQHHVLDIVGLSDELNQLPKGLDTQLSHCGQPLSLQQMLKLKLAYVLLCKPRLVILGAIMDCIEDQVLQEFCKEVAQDGYAIVLSFTSKSSLEYTHCMELNASEQSIEMLRETI